MRPCQEDSKPLLSLKTFRALARAVSEDKRDNVDEIISAYLVENDGYRSSRRYRKGRNRILVHDARANR